MRKLFTILVAVLLTATIWAQSPEKMTYQAVIRAASNELVTNQPIGMQISILQGSTSGTAVYVETQTPTTNANGLVSIEIGTGTTTDDFSTIDWANGPYFIKTETDTAGGTNYTITGISQLLSVPYALHAKTADTVVGKLVETQTLADVLNLGNDGDAKQIKNIAAPTDAKDVVTKEYLEIILEQYNNQIQCQSNFSFFEDTRDGYVYKTIQIGNQTWFAENLRYLPEVVGPNSSSQGTPLYYVYEYDGTDVSEAKSIINYEIFGVLYNWAAAAVACPVGWSLPSHDDWTELELEVCNSATCLNDFPYNTTTLGMLGTDEGSKLSSNSSLWEQGALKNNAKFGLSCFSAIPGGIRSNNSSTFENIGVSVRFWSSTVSDGSGGAYWNRSIESSETGIYRTTSSKGHGFSVRCVKD